MSHICLSKRSHVPENILIVITGVGITGLIRNIIYRWLLGALPRNLNQTDPFL